MRIAAFTEDSQYRDTPEGLHASEDGSRFLVGGVIPVTEERVREMVLAGELRWESHEVERWVYERLGMVVSEPVPPPQEVAQAASSLARGAGTKPTPSPCSEGTTSKTKVAKPNRLVWAVGLIAIIALVAVGALIFRPSAEPEVDPGSTASGESVAPASGEEPSAQPTQSDEGAASAPTPSLSDAAVAYAKGLGGWPHRGDTLYLIICASTKTEAEAQRKLDDAIPMFGDMAGYHIVQKSDNFEGLEPGWFVVFEAFSQRQNAESNLDFSQRGFDGAYIKQVVVKTDDPIPVYEDEVY